MHLKASPTLTNSIQFNSVHLGFTYMYANYKNSEETCKRLMTSRFHAGHPMMFLKTCIRRGEDGEIKRLPIIK